MIYPTGERVKLPLRCVFFCGAESPYGLAHLKPLLEEKRFTVIAVILATEERWEIFRQILSGETTPGIGFSYPLLRGIMSVSRSPSLTILFRKLKNFKSILRMKHAMPGTAKAVRLCKDARIPVWFAYDVHCDDFVEKLRAIEPDLFVCAAYPQIFKRVFLDIPRFGAVNSHPSLLPRYRGAHPIFWAIATGEKESGVTIHYMEERIDAGPIITQIRFSIDENDTYTDVYQKAIACVPQAIRNLADFFESGHEDALPQNDDVATYYRQDREIHHVIFWSLYGAEQIRNLVRAAGGRAFFWHGNKKVFVLKCRISESNRNLTNNVTVPDGTIVDVKNGIAVKVKDGVVTITDWRVDGGRKIDLKVGQVLQ